MEDNKYSKFGNFLARGGGQPTPTPEVLATATPEQLAFYDIQRKTARNKGLGEMLLLMGDAFQGRDISGRAAQRRTLLSQQQAKAKQQKLVEDWKLRNPDRAGDVDALMAGIPESMFSGGAGGGTSLMQNAQYLSGLRQRYNKMTEQQQESKEGKLLLQSINDVVGLGGAGKYDPTLAFTKKSAETAGVQGREFADGPLTKGEVSTDEKFGTFYVNYTKEGRGAKNIGNLENLQDAQDIMEIAAKNGIPISSVPAGLIANRPSLSAFLNPQGVMSQERVANVIQQSLKEILGGQFAQKEGEALILRGYNPSLPVEENLERLLNLKSQVQQIIESEQDSINYYENNKKSLSGYKGKKYTTEDFSRDLSKDYTMDVIGMSDADIENAYMNIPISGSESLWEKTLEKEIKRRADKNR